MRWTRIGRFALGLALLGAAAGCRSLPSPPPTLVGGLVLSPPLSPAEDARANAHALYAVGLHHEMQDESEEALDAYSRAYELDPDSESLVLRIASTYAVLQRPEDAVRLVDHFAQTHPRSIAAHSWLGHFYHSTNEKEAALRHFQRLPEINPANLTNWIQYAEALLLYEDFDASQTVFQDAAAHLSPNADLHRHHARMLLIRSDKTTNAAQAAHFRQLGISQLETVARLDPGDRQILYVLGEIYLMDQRWEDAIQTYQRINLLDPADTRSLQHLAQTFVKMDDLEQATAILEKVSKQTSEAFDIPYALGELYEDEGNRELAERFFQLSARNSTNNAAPWIKLAGFYGDDNPKMAVQTLLDAIQIIPGDGRLYEVLGLIRIIQNRYTRAAGLFEKAWQCYLDDPRQSPSDIFALNYAIALTHLRRPAEAADWLLRALDADPENLTHYVQRATSISPSHLQTATRSLQRLRDLAPPEHQYDISYMLATCYMAQHKLSRAVRTFESFFESIADNPAAKDALPAEAFFFYGILLHFNGEIERVLPLMERCVQLDPDHSDARNFIAYTWAEQGIRLDEALRHSQLALRKQPNNAAYIDTLGWIYYQMGRYEEALNLLRHADSLQPDDPEILEHIEKTLEKLEP